MMGSAITSSPAAQGMEMSAIVRSADSSVARTASMSLRVSAAVIAGMQAMVMVGMNAHGSAKMVCW